MNFDATWVSARSHLRPHLKCDYGRGTACGTGRACCGDGYPTYSESGACRGSGDGSMCGRGEYECNGDSYGGDVSWGMR